MPVFMIYTFREPELLGRICSRLVPHPVVVHVDRKVDATPFVEATRSCPNTRFIENGRRVLVNWGGFSQVEAIRRMMRVSVEICAPDDHVVLLSGQDYPIKPIPAFTEYLGTAPWRQHIRYFDLHTASERYTRKVTRRHHRDLPLLATRTRNPRIRTIRNACIRLADFMSNLLLPAVPAPEGIELAYGPTHFALTRDCAQTVLRAMTEDLDDFFRRTFCPEELYVQSLVASTEYHSETPTGGFERFEGVGNWRYANFHHIHSSLTKVYTLEDWQEVATSPAYFLRKLESGRSGPLLDRIDAELLTHGSAE